jgi:hypothetical protein
MRFLLIVPDFIGRLDQLDSSPFAEHLEMMTEFFSIFRLICLIFIWITSYLLERTVGFMKSFGFCKFLLLFQSKFATPLRSYLFFDCIIGIALAFCVKQIQFLWVEELQFQEIVNGEDLGRARFQNLPHAKIDELTKIFKFSKIGDDASKTSTE